MIADLFWLAKPSLAIFERLITSDRVEWRRGTSPPRSHRSVREPLDSYGSYRPTATYKR